MTRLNAFLVTSLGNGIHHHCQKTDNRLNTYNSFRNPLKYGVRKVQPNQRSTFLMRLRMYKDKDTGQGGVNETRVAAAVAKNLIQRVDEYQSIQDAREFITNLNNRLGELELVVRERRRALI